MQSSIKQLSKEGNFFKFLTVLTWAFNTDRLVNQLTALQQTEGHQGISTSARPCRGQYPSDIPTDKNIANTDIGSPFFVTLTALYGLSRFFKVSTGGPVSGPSQCGVHGALERIREAKSVFPVQAGEACRVGV
ncbi:unnamed protein product [Polarella glacialis]|uniref:Uncharacterized protein n=1 Tax=Polarella glacialis TaxID=89957 RepID=A0A813IYW7_POLGL|nr:unnamed protein product [Polarella glacialis]